MALIVPEGVGREAQLVVVAEPDHYVHAGHIVVNPSTCGVGHATDVPMP